MMEERKETAKEVIERIEQKRLKSVKIGKELTRWIALVGILAVLLGVPFMFRNVLSIICTVVEAVTVFSVYWGAKRVRYIYAVLFGALSLNVIHPLLIALFDYKPTLSTLGIALMLAFRLAYLIFSSVILFGSKNISEYVYEINNK